MEKIDKGQFVELVEKHQTSLYRLAMSLLRNEHDAEDAVSSAIYKAYNGRNTIRDVGNFKSWILRIVSNEAYNILRKQKRLVYMEEIPAEIQQENEAETPYDVWDAVQKLDEKFRAIVVLHYYEDLSIKSISEVLDMKQNTVKVRLFRARQQLQAILIKQGRLANEQ